MLKWLGTTAVAAIVTQRYLLCRGSNGDLWMKCIMLWMKMFLPILYNVAFPIAVKASREAEVVLSVTDGFLIPLCFCIAKLLTQMTA